MYMKYLYTQIMRPIPQLTSRGEWGEKERTQTVLGLFSIQVRICKGDETPSWNAFVRGKYGCWLSDGARREDIQELGDVLAKDSPGNCYAGGGFRMIGNGHRGISNRYS